MKVGARSRWSGRNVLITAGPTREPMDPIRFLTNASSGTMGFALAQAARDRGAEVTVVSGPCEFASSPGIRVIPVVTAEQMHRQVLSHCGKADVVIAAAAVGDWKFKKISSQKVKKTGRPLHITLLPNPDIIADVSRRLHARKGLRRTVSRSISQKGARKDGRNAGSAGSRKIPVLAGFALETGRWLFRAREKMRRKGLDVIVANKLDSLGFGRARVAVLDRRGEVSRLPAMSKSRAAREILRRVEAFF